MSVAAPLVLRAGDESRLAALVRSSRVEAGAAQRAGIVLLAAEGVSNAEIGRKRDLAGGLAGLGDLARPGRPSVIDDAAVVVAMLQKPPPSLGVTH